MTLAAEAERRPLVIGALLVTLGICLLFGIGNVVYSATAWEIPDVGASWNAALRGRAAVTVILTALLVAPMLLFDLGGYTTSPGSSQSLYGISPILFAAVGGASVLVAMYVAWRHRPWAWLAASVAVILCLPRAFTYELTFLFVGLVPAIDAWRRRPVAEPAA